VQAQAVATSSSGSTAGSRRPSVTGSEASLDKQKDAPPQPPQPPQPPPAARVPPPSPRKAAAGGLRAYFDDGSGSGSGSGSGAGGGGGSGSGGAGAGAVLTRRVGSREGRDTAFPSGGSVDDDDDEDITPGFVSSLPLSSVGPRSRSSSAVSGTSAGVAGAASVGSAGAHVGAGSSSSGGGGGGGVRQPVPGLPRAPSRGPVAATATVPGTSALAAAPPAAPRIQNAGAAFDTRAQLQPSPAHAQLPSAVPSVAPSPPLAAWPPLPRVVTATLDNIVRMTEQLVAFAQGDAPIKVALAAPSLVAALLRMLRPAPFALLHHPVYAGVVLRVLKTIKFVSMDPPPWRCCPTAARSRRWCRSWCATRLALPARLASVAARR
jgi:hypothetical protein